MSATDDAGRPLDQDHPRNRRYNAHFCEVCGASAGAVQNGWIVCDRHFARPLPDVKLFDGKSGERLITVVDENGDPEDDHPPMFLFEPDKKVSEMTDEERRAFADRIFDVLADQVRDDRDDRDDPGTR